MKLSPEQKAQVRKDLFEFHRLKDSPMSNSKELLTIIQRVMETLAAACDVFDLSEGSQNG